LRRITATVSDATRQRTTGDCTGDSLVVVSRCVAVTRGAAAPYGAATQRNGSDVKEP